MLVVDEAQHLRSDVIEDLRLLTNFDMDTAPRLCLVLIGLTGLRQRLSMAVHESMQQRLIVQHHLRGLTREELDPYLGGIACAWPAVNCPCSIPPPSRRCTSARGLPRLINRIAHYALSAAAVEEARTVDAEHLARAVEDVRP